MNEALTTRRQFLQMVGVTGGGLVVSVALPACAAPGLNFDHGAGTYFHNALIQIAPDSRIHFYNPRSEMGQGVYNGMTTLIAEELSTDPDKIEVHFAPVHEAYQSPESGMQSTGGSTSMRVFYTPMRQAAANAREALLQAAAEQLGVAKDSLTLDNGKVIAESGSYPFGDFTALAGQRPIPENAPLKPAAQFKYIGKETSRIDAPAKVDGSAMFGLDADFPGLKKAVLQRCPVAGGKVKSFDGDAVKAMPGVLAVVDIETGVAVVGEHYWQTRQAAEKLNIEWDLPELADLSTDKYFTQLRQQLTEDKGGKAHREGEGAKGLENASEVVKAEYSAPFLAHATMEPMNCTIKIDGDKADVWTSTQIPQVVQGLVARHAGLDAENVNVHSSFLGGGFGRRLYSDYVVEATKIAVASGFPIQLIWSREEDTRNDVYRPGSVARFEASVNDDGLIDTFFVKRAGANAFPAIIDSALPTLMPLGLAEWVGNRVEGVVAGFELDTTSTEGLYEDYDAPNKEARHVTVDSGLSVGFWRSVGHSFSGFFKESFIDELAHHAGVDPYEFRMNNSKKDKRFAEVIKLAATKGNWGNPRHAGATQGIAAHTSFYSRVAEVAEVSVENGNIKVHRITCAVDCGLAVNPDIVKAQMESSIIYGLTATLYGKIDIEAGQVRQSNFHDYPMLRMQEAPEIEVHIVPSQEAPTGVGEPGLPPVAAAVANAVYKATGKRLRELPLSLA